MPLSQSDRTIRISTSLQWLWRLSLITLLFSVGCQNPTLQHFYEGPQRSTSELSLLKCTDFRDEFLIGRVLTTRISHVDGKMTSSLFFNTNQLAPESLYVIPGKHNIHVYYNDGYYYAGGNLWLVTEPGKTYLLRTHQKGYGCFFFFQEEESGKAVGGIKGSDDEPPDKTVSDTL